MNTALHQRLIRQHERNRLATIAPIVRDVPTSLIEKAPYALQARPSPQQHDALIDSSLNTGAPCGRILARQPEGTEGPVEVLSGWVYLATFLEGYRHATSVPLTLIEASDTDAVFYAIEYADEDYRAAGFMSSPTDYAMAAEKARTHFARGGKPWSITETAAALKIARPTLANRLRLLRGLPPQVLDRLDKGQIPPEIAKILMGEKDAVRQVRLVEEYLRRPVTAATMYQRVHPDYQPPKKAVNRRRGGTPLVADDVGVVRRLQERYSAPASVSLDHRLPEGAWVELRFYTLSSLRGLLDRIEAKAETEEVFAGELRFTASSAKGAHQLLTELKVLEDDSD